MTELNHQVIKDALEILRFGGQDKSISAHDQYAELKTIWYENKF